MSCANIRRHRRSARSGLSFSGRFLVRVLVDVPAMSQISDQLIVFSGGLNALDALRVKKARVTFERRFRLVPDARDAADARSSSLRAAASVPPPLSSLCHLRAALLNQLAFGRASHGIMGCMVPDVSRRIFCALNPLSSRAPMPI